MPYSCCRNLGRGRFFRPKWANFDRSVESREMSVLANCLPHISLRTSYFSVILVSVDSN